MFNVFAFFFSVIILLSACSASRVLQISFALPLFGSSFISAEASKVGGGGRMKGILSDPCFSSLN